MHLNFSFLQIAGFRTSCKIRSLAVIAFLSFLTLPVHSQQLEISRSRGTGSFMTFSEWKGFSVGWNQKLKSGTKIGISFDYALKNKPYSWVYTAIDYNTGNMTEKIYVENRDPYNQRFAASIYAAWCALQSKKAAIYWGPVMSLNWMRIHEKTHRYANEWFVDADYYNLYTKKKRFGIGIFIEFEIREIIFERLSVSMRLHSETNGYGGLGSWNRSEPDVITWVGADLGLKWNFGKIKP